MPDNLQFDRAELDRGALGLTGTMTCSACGSVLKDSYYVANGHIVCDNCRRSVEADWNRGGAGRFGKALVLGILATIACSIVWYVVLKATDSQWGILAVVSDSSSEARSAKDRTAAADGATKPSRFFSPTPQSCRPISRSLSKACGRR